MTFEEGVIRTEAFQDIDLCTSSRNLLELAFNLYNNYEGDSKTTVLDMFYGLDEQNFQVAMGAIKYRCS
ncbi:hypothetical protein HZI73_10720 [Vallitalea pronyensis]|uniref:Uncharacterized protein n=1 Tax=Vallitalea pronyensis TaxID=1348613 RepID=A0A8J8MJD0_9FIRM|nr:DUF6075 family protein [Vallitalea pronyensis]QUI22734.1 hypothetical protein HZI73_10720 [Vallitalea pronyensis]